MERTREQIAADISKFAEDNKVHIHPGPDSLSWADLILKNGGCPCVPTRHRCPCEFVSEDIKELGRCRCGLFCNDTYLREYNALVSKRKSNSK